MHQKQGTEQSVLHFKDSSKSKQRFKELLAHSKEYETLCLNQSQLKHMHAIRPYCNKQRKTSRRESKHNQSPYEMSRSNSKRLENSSRKSEDSKQKKSSQNLSGVGNKQMGDMMSELINLKSEYKILKGNYTNILSEKQEEILQEQKEKSQLAEELEKRNKEVERHQKNTTVLEQQIDRIKKECSKILQMQRFKIKKLEETLQEKDLMIAFLRNQNENLRKGNPDSAQPLFFLQNSSAMLNFSYFNKQGPNISALSNIVPDQAKNIPQAHLDEDSLSLSRDKSKEMDSIIHSFLSNNETFIHQPNFTKKETILINSLQQSPIEAQIEVIEQKSEQSQKQVIDYKRFTKEIRDGLQGNKETISMKNKLRPNAKKLQIFITDENADTQNVTQNLKQELSMQTKKKMTNNSMIMCKQKKKLTAKKIKQF